MDPRASRPKLADVYGLPATDENLLPWSHVCERMEAAKHYWLASVAPGGAPHARPVDGMWMDERLYFGGSPDAKWWRNLAANASASVHLEDAEQAVIVEGHVRFMRPEAELAKRLADASNRKYTFGQKASDYEGAEILEFAPARAFAWTVFTRDATRFTLE